MIHCLLTFHCCHGHCLSALFNSGCCGTWLAISWVNSVRSLARKFFTVIQLAEADQWIWPVDLTNRPTLAPLYDCQESLRVNPFTLRVHFESIVCYSHTFENNLGIKWKLTNYLSESCCVASDEHFFIKSFPNIILVSKISPKLSGLFWPL